MVGPRKGGCKIYTLRIGSPLLRSTAAMPMDSPLPRPIRSPEDLEPLAAEILSHHPRSRRGLREHIGRLSNFYTLCYRTWAERERALGCDMGNGRLQQEVERYHTSIEPRAEELMYRMQRSIVDHPSFPDLKRDETYRTIAHLLQREVDSYVPECQSIRQEVGSDERRCERTIGNLAVRVDAHEVPLAQARLQLTSPDRDVREGIWRTMQDKRLEAKEILDIVHGGMIRWRHAMAQKARHPNFDIYQHHGPSPTLSVSAALAFDRTMRREAVPLSAIVTDRQLKRLGLRSVAYPWDTDPSRWGMHGTPKNEFPLRPFQSERELVQKTGEVLERLDPAFALFFDRMVQENRIDIRTRKGKSPYAFCIGSGKNALPSIVASMSGSHQDMVTMMHEMGHAIHNGLTSAKALIFHQDSYTDTAMDETASMGMELLTMPHWDVFYTPEEHRFAMRMHLEELIRSLPWCALIDRFEHKLYQDPLHNTQQTQDEWFAGLMKRYYPDNITWRGLEKYRKNYWQIVPHVFSAPFYTIEYAVAVLGALQLYRNALQDPKSTVRAYARGLRMGASKPFPAVWAAMGIRYVTPSSPQFPEHVRGILQFVMEQLDALEHA